MTAHRSLAALATVALACGPGLPSYTTATTADVTTSTTSGLSASSTGAGATAITSDAPTTTGTSGCNTLDCTSSTGPQCLDESGELRCTLECDVWTQDCPKGQKCTPWASDGGSWWNDVKCVPVMPNAGKPGDACTVEGNETSGVDTCDASSMRWNVSPDTGEGKCVAFCTGSPASPECAEAGTDCAVSQSGILNLCQPGCNPLAPDCPSLELCVPQPLGEGFICVPDASGDAGAQNDPCDAFDSCDPGLICLSPSLAVECDPMAEGCCLPVCDLSNPVCTNEDAECLSWYGDSAPPGSENIGVCGIMK